MTKWLQVCYRVQKLIFRLFHRRWNYFRVFRRKSFYLHVKSRAVLSSMIWNSSESQFSFMTISIRLLQCASAQVPYFESRFITIHILSSFIYFFVDIWYNVPPQHEEHQWGRPQPDGVWREGGSSKPWKIIPSSFARCDCFHHHNHHHHYHY